MLIRKRALQYALASSSSSSSSKPSTTQRRLLMIASYCDRDSRVVFSSFRRRSEDRGDISVHRHVGTSLKARDHLVLQHTRRFCTTFNDEDFSTLHSLRVAAQRKYENRPFLGTKNLETKEFEYVTYGDFGKKVDYLAAVLSKDRGVKPGDKIAVISKNREEWAVAAYACFAIGAHYVPMYEQQRDEDWEYIIRDSEAKHLFVSTVSIHDRVRDLALIPSENVVCFDNGDFDRVLQQGVNISKELDHPNPNPDDVCVLIYTSGTTGKPKGVMLSHRNIASNVRASREIFGHRLSREDTGLSILPWAHVFGQTLDLHAMMSAGCRLGLVHSKETLAEDLKLIKPTLMSGVPLIFKTFYDRIQNVIETSPFPKNALMKWALRAGKRRRKVFDEGRDGFSPLVAVEWYVVSVTRTTT